MDRAGQRFFAQGQGDSLVGAPGGSAVFDPEAQTRRELAEVRAPVPLAASCGSRSKPLRRGLARPMLFAQKLLAPGPQPKHPGNRNVQEPGG